MVNDTCNSLSGNTLFIQGKNSGKKPSFINGLQKCCPVFCGIFLFWSSAYYFIELHKFPLKHLFVQKKSFSMINIVRQF